MIFLLYCNPFSTFLLIFIIEYTIPKLTDLNILTLKRENVSGAWSVAIALWDKSSSQRVEAACTLNVVTGKRDIWFHETDSLSNPASLNNVSGNDRRRFPERSTTRRLLRPLNNSDGMSFIEFHDKYNTYKLKA